MNFDLTEQFVRDFETIRERVEALPEAEPTGPAPELIEEIHRLKSRIADLDKEARSREAALRRKGDETRDQQAKSLAESEAASREARAALASKDEEVGQLQSRATEVARSVIALKKSHQLELERKDQVIQQLTGELVIRRKEQEAALAKLSLQASSVDRKQMTRLWDDKVGMLRAQIAEEFRSKLGSVTYLPLRLRVAAFVFDLLALTIAAGLLERWNPGWTASAGRTEMLLGVLALRTFLSPGRFLLGISPRHVGSENQPTGPAGLMARFFCGIFHYGPLIVTAHYLGAAPSSVEAMGKLGAWVMNPLGSLQPLSSILMELFKPSSPTLPGVLLAMTIAWWGGLAVSLLISPWVYRTVPYFWNTTLVESIWRVGYQRFPWPKSAFEKAE